MWGLIALGIGVAIFAFTLACAAVLVGIYIKAIIRIRRIRRRGIDRWI